VQGKAALLAAAHGSVEVGQPRFVHKVKRTTTPHRQPQEPTEAANKSRAEPEVIDPKFLAPGMKCVVAGTMQQPARAAGVRAPVQSPLFPSMLDLLR